MTRRAHETRASESREPLPTVDVIVVAFGAEPLLQECIMSILSSEGVRVRVLLVDNGCSNPALSDLSDDPNVVILPTKKNVGFAGGVSEAAAQATGSHLALVNSDAVVEPLTLHRLTLSLRDPRVGIVMPLIIRRDDGSINSAGNPLHVLGYSWAGGNGQDPTHVRSGPIPVASGAALMTTHETWTRLGGVPARFFMYQEDVDLSLACHQAGLRVEINAECAVQHDHDWSRNGLKTELAERNRLAIIVTRYPTRLLLGLTPLLLAVELGAVIIGGLPGVRSAKLRGYVWLLTNARWLVQRRRENLSRAAFPSGFIPFLTDTFDVSAPDAGPGPALLNRVIPRLLRTLGVHPSSPQTQGAAN